MRHRIRNIEFLIVQVEQEIDVDSKQLLQAFELDGHDITYSLPFGDDYKTFSPKVDNDGYIIGSDDENYTTLPYLENSQSIAHITLLDDKYIISHNGLQNPSVKLGEKGDFNTFYYDFSNLKVLDKSSFASYVRNKTINSIFDED